MGEPCGFLPKRQIAQCIAGYRGEPETWPKNSLRGFDGGCPLHRDRRHHRDANGGRRV